MRRLVLVLVACACAASPARGSSARLFALGGDGAYLEDAVAARVWYGSLVDHGGWAALESGAFNQQDGYARDGAGWRASGPAAGAHVPLGADGRHGTAALWWDSRTAGGSVGELGNDRLADAWQVMIARRLGGLTAGLSLRHGSGEHEYLSTLRVRRERDEFGLGARCDLGEAAYLDLAGELVRLAQESTVDAGEPQENDTFASYGLRGRAFVQAAPGLVAVPVVEHRIEKRELDPVLGSTSRRLWRLGAGLTWLPDPDHLVLLATDWRQARHATDGHATVTADVFEFRLACEARIHALLSVRLASGYRHSDLGTGAGGAAARHDVPVSAGLAVHFGPADLDVALANLRPVGPDGLPEPWSTDDDATWLSAGLSWWF